MTISCSGCCTPTVPGRVLESFGIRRDPFRQAFIASMGDPWDDKPTHTTLSPAMQLMLERANFEAARLADAEVASEHVLLALIGRGHVPAGWVARSGITADAVRRRVVDATEGVALPEPPEQLQPLSPYGSGSEDALDLAPNPLGYPVLTTDGRPVHIVVDEDTVPVLDDHGHEMLGPVEVPEGARMVMGPEPS